MQERKTSGHEDRFLNSEIRHMKKSAARFGTGNGKMKSKQRTPAAFTRAENELKTEPVSEEISKEKQARTSVCSDRSYEEKSRKPKPHRKTSALGNMNLSITLNQESN
jgi:hypothetical protein